MIDLPDSFINRITGTYPESGEAWLNTLPDLLRDIQHWWGLELLPPPFPFSYHTVIPCRTQNGMQAVLKLGVPHQELTWEIQSLQHFRGKGAVRLIKAEAEKGVMLLERLQPGHTLLDVDDPRRAATIAADAAHKLWSPPPAGQSFPTVSEWGQGFVRLRKAFRHGKFPFPRDVVNRAKSIFQNLLKTSADPVLLHGDLHHRNILRGRNTWLTIDPKGVIGEPAYEVGAYLRNPMPEILEWDQFQQRTDLRLDIFQERCSLPRQRMLLWAFAQCVLAAWWSYEENSSAWKSWMSIAHQFHTMLP